MLRIGKCHTLEELVERVNTIELASAKEGNRIGPQVLQDILNTAQELGIEDLPLASRCEVRTALIGHYRKGEVTPHELYIRVVVDGVRDLALKSIIEKKLRTSS